MSEDQVFVLSQDDFARVVFCIQGQTAKIAIFADGVCTKVLDCTTVQARKAWKRWIRRGFTVEEAV